MSDNISRPKTRVVIAGGGTAGWITAAALSSQLGVILDIILVESDAIGTIGVGEATIPTHCAFHRLIGVNEQEFMRATGASFKLGIAFENWGRIGDRYIHSFGQIGKPTWMADFYPMWAQAKALGFGGDLDDYCYELQAAEAGKFATSEQSNISYAYHLDAGKYAQFLRKKSEKAGVTRQEGKIDDVQINSENGTIESIILEDGSKVEGDIFIDCTGFRALLMRQALGVEFDDWSAWLPMNRAVALQSEGNAAFLPYTRAIARDCGWQWQIPLQHRTGNGHVFCSDFMDDDAALKILMDNLPGKALTDPRFIGFQTGKLQKAWEKNCIAIGLSGGFMEPLESTSIHLIQIAVTRLIKMFPHNDNMCKLAAYYNSEVDEEYDSIKDFLILHYFATQRDDTEFWKSRQNMSIPDSLRERIELYKESGIAYQHGLDLFRVDSWHQVFRGQGIEAQSFHPMGQLFPPETLRKALHDLKNNITNAVQKMPPHKEFVSQYCAEIT